MSEITFWFFLACGVVGVAITLWGAWHLVTRDGDGRENALWVARGVLILALLWFLLS